MLKEELSLFVYIITRIPRRLEVKCRSDRKSSHGFVSGTSSCVVCAFVRCNTYTQKYYVIGLLHTEILITTIIIVSLHSQHFIKKVTRFLKITSKFLPSGLHVCKTFITTFHGFIKKKSLSFIVNFSLS